MILDNIGTDHPESGEIIRLLNKTSESLLGLMNADGSFNTLLTHSSYRELSATALISAGWLHGVRCGYLDEKFREPALRALAAVIDAIEIGEDGVFMPEISGPTIPLPLLPKLGYKLIPTGRNWSYGIAALIFAAIEYKKLLG
jgi:unsaturated rhamnogalacturonyl hydrolase